MYVRATDTVQSSQFRDRVAVCWLQGLSILQDHYYVHMRLAKPSLSALSRQEVKTGSERIQSLGAHDSYMAFKVEIIGLVCQARCVVASGQSRAGCRQGLLDVGLVLPTLPPSLPTPKSATWYRNANLSLRNANHQEMFLHFPCFSAPVRIPGLPGWRLYSVC